jgi:transposase-like protein
MKRGRRPYERYPESFKLDVVKYYYDHDEDRKQTMLKYGIDHSCLRDWLLRYESREKALSLHHQMELEMRKRPKLPSDPSLAQSEYERIQRELEEAQMRIKGYEVLIELAEQEYGIKIKKNSGAQR